MLKQYVHVSAIDMTRIYSIVMYGSDRTIFLRYHFKSGCTTSITYCAWCIWKCSKAEVVHWHKYPISQAVLYSFSLFLILPWIPSARWQMSNYFNDRPLVPIDHIWFKMDRYKIRSLLLGIWWKYINIGLTTFEWTGTCSCNDILANILW